MIQERLIQFIDYKGISKYKFYQVTGLANGFLDKKGSIGADKCEIIYSYFSEINLEWLITGQGSMLKSEVVPIMLEKQEDVGKIASLELDNERLKETNELLRFKVATLEKQLTEFRYNSQKEPVLYKDVAESAPE